jgi:hypothetical protein
MLTQLLGVGLGIAVGLVLGLSRDVCGMSLDPRFWRAKLVGP